MAELRAEGEQNLSSLAALREANVQALLGNK